MCEATIITGTGRCGTTFLVGLLSILRLPTGFDSKTVYREIWETDAHAGLEKKPGMVSNNLTCSERLQIYKSPQIFKDPKWLGADNLAYTIVPLRRSEDAALSRAYQSKYHNPHRGGLNGNAHTDTEQMAINDHAVATFFWRASALVQLKLITLSYPEHVENEEYAYTKLKPFLDMYNVGKETFVHAHVKLRNKNFTHTYS